jgi:hypothetical protein
MRIRGQLGERHGRADGSGHIVQTPREARHPGGRGHGERVRVHGLPIPIERLTQRKEGLRLRQVGRDLFQHHRELELYDHPRGVFGRKRTQGSQRFDGLLARVEISFADTRELTPNDGLESAGIGGVEVENTLIGLGRVRDGKAPLFQGGERP